MDILSYSIGLKKGKQAGEQSINIGSDCTFTDENINGNITIEKESE